MKKQFFYLTVLTALFFASCSDGDTPVDNKTPKEAKTLLILNEGGIGHNNSTLARYDLESGTLDKDYFRTVNNRGLGDTGNDMVKYGSKIYVVVNVSSTIEVMDGKTGKSLKQIPMKSENGSGKQPRQIAAHDGKVYVTSFDDTVVQIDTATYNIDATLTVGLDPDGICAGNSKIYVANSGGLNYMNGYDNTISVIDAVTFKEEKKVEVGTNPGTIGSDTQGDLYVSVLGNYSTVPASFKKLDAKSGNVITINEISSPGKFVISDNKAYIISGSYGNPYSLKIFDCLNEKLITENFITDGTEIGIINNVSVDAFSGDVFLTETDYTNPGNVYCFDKNGKLKYTLKTVGINPSVVVFM